MATVNRQIRLAARPVGLPKESDWRREEEAVPEPAPGEVVIRNRYISVDPAMRGWMNDRPSYLPPVALGAVMRALTVGEVVAANKGAFKVGDFVSGAGGVQDYVASNGKGWSRIDLSLAPLPAWLGTLGIAGLTAYCGLIEVGRPKAGETVVVSGAAGSVGAHAGQIARLRGCRVVGIAGGAEKCAWLTDELGFDAAIDYSSESVAAGLKRACPDGVDLFFDNVGGETLDAVLARSNPFARIVLCGAISQYNATEAPYGLRNAVVMIPRRVRMQGFIYFDYREKWPAMLKELAGWLGDGRIRSREDIVTGGVAAFPETLLRLFSGDNFGKLMIETGD